jgi:hypothetical protein
MKMLLAVVGVAAITAGAGAAQAAPRANAQPASTPAGAIGTASANVVYDEYGRYGGRSGSEHPLPAATRGGSASGILEPHPLEGNVQSVSPARAAGVSFSADGLRAPGQSSTRQRPTHRDGGWLAAIDLALLRLDGAGQAARRRRDDLCPGAGAGSRASGGAVSCFSDIFFLTRRVRSAKTPRSDFERAAAEGPGAFLFGSDQPSCIGR